MASRICSEEETYLQNSDVHHGSQSEMMESGRPKWLATTRTNISAKSKAVSPVVIGTNWACLVSQSTMTHMALNNPNFSRFTMKSIEIDSYGRPGMGLGIRVPYRVKFLCLVF